MREKAPMSNDQIAALFDLTGRTAVVTGAAGVLGSTLAHAFAAYGADVALVDLEPEAMADLADEVRALGRKAACLRCDVVDVDSVASAMNETVRTFGRLDILVTAAGISDRMPAEVFLIERWQRVMDVNVRGTFACAQAAARHMIPAGGGKIITIGSVRGFLGVPAGNAAYTTSKGAVHLLTKQLATEWARYRINVNCIAPSLFLTPLTQDVFESEKMRSDMLSRIPWGRPGVPVDFVGPAIYLASSASDYVTGAILSVDGGSVAG
jgi:NAD(P)-dependent dehydrogenase (short-subunit alcohol dehydrogenase family)